MSGPSPQLSRYYQDVFRQLAPRLPLPEVEIEFYRYAGLKSTIRLRDGRILVRLSDLLAEAPDEVQQALAQVLVAKLRRRPVPAGPAALYQEYARQPQVAQSAARRRQEQGRKYVTSAQGSFYHLERIFDKLNRRYFAGALARPTLTWSQREARRILGHHDAAHDTIVVSRILDTAETPDWVVEFVVYHEMLHIVHPVHIVKGRRCCHSAAFRADERRFPYYEEAQAWISGYTPVPPQTRRRVA